MSALPPIADIAESDWHVRFVPEADIVSARCNVCQVQKLEIKQTPRAHSPGKRLGELADRFETRTAPMVTFGAGAAAPVFGAPSGCSMPAAIMARPSRVGLLISLTLSLISSSAASGCPVLILRILLTKTL